MSPDTDWDTILHQLLSAASREEARRILRQFPRLTSEAMYPELTRRIAENRRRRDPLLGMMALMAGRGFLHRCQVSESLDEALAGQPGWPLYNQGPLNRLLALPETAPADERIDWAELASRDVDSEAEPDFRGLVDFHLGWGFQDKAEEGSKEARDQAIEHFEKAERAWQLEDSLFGGRLLGLVQEYLGRLYLERRHRDRIQDVETALSWLQKAHDTFGKDTPQKQLALSMLLGKTYLSRVKGERLQNIEDGINCYHRAHALAEQSQEEKLLGDIEYSLAFAYRLRMQGDPADNYEQARKWAERARDRFDRQRYPEEWARITGEVATIYAHRLRGEREANLEAAIDYAKQALEIYKPDTHPRQWILVQLTLGNMYCDRISGRRADNDKKAINCFQNVLKHCTPESEPVYWSEAMNNLGTVHASHAMRLNNKKYRAAIGCFGKALEVREPETMPARALQTATNWGNLEFWFSNWSQAHQAYAIALRAAEKLYRASYSPSGKEAELTDITTLYERMVQVCLNEPDYRAGLQAVEGGKARTFLDQMGLAAFPPPPGVPQDLLRGEAELIEHLRRQELTLVVRADDQFGANEGDEASGTREILTQRREVLDALETVWNEMEGKSQAARNYVAARRGDPVRWEDLSTLAERLGAGVALLEFYTLPDEIVVFVLRSGWRTPRVHRAPVNRCQLDCYVNDFFDQPVEQSSGPAHNQTWQDLANPLLGEVMPYLKDVKLLYFIPHGSLHDFPLHALEVDGAPLIKHFPVAYAPSAAVLKRVLEQAEQRVTGSPGPALVVGDPAGNLEYAEKEAKVIARHLRVTPYLGQAATKQLLLDEIQDKRIVHLACHGAFDSLDPLRSGLELHDATLTARDILKLRLSADLMVLSACETARQQVSRGDELMGLMRVLLYAGASSLVVSLWSVYDASTSELMQRFYDVSGSSQHLNYAECLQQAMLEIRRQPRWAHPYYWAPFILVGGV